MHAIITIWNAVKSFSLQVSTHLYYQYKGTPSTNKIKLNLTSFVFLFSCCSSAMYFGIIFYYLPLHCNATVMAMSTTYWHSLRVSSTALSSAKKNNSDGITGWLFVLKCCQFAYKIQSVKFEGWSVHWHDINFPEMFTPFEREWIFMNHVTEMSLKP